jgi:hypothetical protein
LRLQILCLKLINWLVNTKKIRKYDRARITSFKAVCIDAEKNEIPVTPFSKTIIMESDKDRYIQTLSFRTETNQNVRHRY